MQNQMPYSNNSNNNYWGQPWHEESSGDNNTNVNIEIGVNQQSGTDDTYHVDNVVIPGSSSSRRQRSAPETELNLNQTLNVDITNQTNIVFANINLIVDLNNEAGSEDDVSQNPPSGSDYGYGYGLEQTKKRQPNQLTPPYQMTSKNSEQFDSNMKPKPASFSQIRKKRNATNSTISD